MSGVQAHFTGYRQNIFFIQAKIVTDKQAFHINRSKRNRVVIIILYYSEDFHFWSRLSTEYHIISQILSFKRAYIII